MVSALLRLLSRWRLAAALLASAGVLCATPASAGAPGSCTGKFVNPAHAHSLSNRLAPQ